MAISRKPKRRRPPSGKSPKHWFCLCAHQWQRVNEKRAADDVVLTRGRWQLVRRSLVQHVSREPVPPAIHRLGRKPQEYAKALINLVQYDCDTAELALVQLERQAVYAKNLDVRAAIRQIAFSEAVAVDLHPMAQWKTDSFGLIALELILWVWRERTQTRRWRTRCFPSWFGCHRWEKLQSHFDRQSEKSWWFLARHELLDTYSNPERLPEFKKLVTAAASLRADKLTHSYIVNRIHQRFRAFAAFLGQ